MGDLTKNLSRREFACKCECGFDTIDFQLVDWLQACVDWFERTHGRQVRIHICSGNRCEKHNAREGGSPRSWHIKGRAADFKLFWRDTGEQIDPELVAEYFEEYHPGCGLGRYYNRTHIDSRGRKARWDTRRPM